MAIADVVADMLNSGYTAARLAAELDVSEASVQRWLSGAGSPRPKTEGQLRALHRFVAVDGDEQPRLPLGPDLSAVLAEIRECLHRRGRLSSRNEALDEVAKLLFAHVMSMTHDGPGISSELLVSDRDGPAVALRRFTDEMHRRYLPVSLAHEMPLSDFALRLKPQEAELAKEIADSLARLDVRSVLQAGDRPDLLNDLFGRFIADSFIDEKELGQYLTPTEVVEFMVGLAVDSLTSEERDLLSDPKQCVKFGTVLDPSCGVGSFLTTFLRAAMTLIPVTATSGRKRWLQTMANKVIVGMDKSERMVRLALANMAMFGFPAANLHLGNSLATRGAHGTLAAGLNGTVSLILTNPPFGATFPAQEVRDYRISGVWAASSPTTVDSELLFMERYLHWLRPGGQLLAIIPDSILTNKGLFERLRRGIADEVSLQDIVSLPPITFASAGTTTKTSVVHLRKRMPGSAARSVRFAICHDIGFTVVTRGSQRRKVRTGRSELADLREMLTGKTTKDARIRVTENVEGSNRWDATYHASLPPALYERIDNPSPDDLFIRDIAVLSSSRTDPRRRADKEFLYIEISDVDGDRLTATPKLVPRDEAPSRARRLVRTGDVLVSTVRPANRSIAVVREDQDGAVCTTGFAVLTPKGIHPLLLGYLLRTDFVTAQLLRNNVGIAYPAIEESCFPEILLPVARHELAHLEEEAESLMVLERTLGERRAALERAVYAAIRPA